MSGKDQEPGDRRTDRGADGRGSDGGRSDTLLGPAPKVFGRERLRAGIHAALFGGSGPDADDTEPGAAPTQDDDRPATVGRFELLERLGSGGMGVVYAAYDRELERRIAIKLLRSDIDATAGSQGIGRLLREAKAMARLSHPNVVTVHEVGTSDGRVFVAMEYVQGPTLRQWLDGRPPWREILDVFVGAGRGLVAAHTQGLVHRDFKPDNVLLERSSSGAIERARVVDFGLARAANDVPTEPVQIVAERVTGEVAARDDLLGSALTETGAVMGTPAYMSPEQFSGRTADARSDQFSFCVALYEGLYGRRPFTASSLHELMRVVTDGRADPPPAGNPVPGWIWPVVRRGLAPAPEDRWPSMAALLERLRLDATRRWRRAALGGGALLGASLATWGASAWWFGTDAAACERATEVLTEVWNPNRRAAIEDALAGASNHEQPVLVANTLAALDRYAQAWTRGSHETCAALRVAAPGDEGRYERRRRCLDAHRAELAALVDSFERADLAIALDSMLAVGKLSDVNDCADERRLANWQTEDPTALAALTQARMSLGMARAHLNVGRYDDAATTIEEVRRVAQRWNEPALEAEALWLRGRCEAEQGRPERAVASLERASELAQLASAHVTRVHTMIELTYLYGEREDGWSESERVAAEAHGAIEVLGGDPLLQARLDNNRGVVARRNGDLPRAQMFLLRSLGRYRELYGDAHPITSRSYANLALLYSSMGEHEQAEEHGRRALDIAERLLGPEHPGTGVVLGNLAVILTRQNDREAALPLFERALAIRERSQGPSHPAVLDARYNVALARSQLGRYEDSLPLLERVIGERLAKDGKVPTHWLVNAGKAAVAGGRRDLAEPWLGEVIGRPGSGPADLAESKLFLAIGRTPDDRAAARALVDESLQSFASAGDELDAWEQQMWALAKAWKAIDESLTRLVDR